MSGTSVSKLSLILEIKGKFKIRCELKRHLAPTLVGKINRSLPLSGNSHSIEKNAVYFQTSVEAGLQRTRREFKKGDEQTPLIVRGAIEDSGKIIPTSEFGHNLSNKYPKKKVEVTDVPNTFVFHVETDGSMSSDELITSSVQSLCNRAGALGEGISI